MCFFDSDSCGLRLFNTARNLGMSGRERPPQNGYILVGMDVVSFLTARHSGVSTVRERLPKKDIFLLEWTLSLLLRRGRPIFLCVVRKRSPQQERFDY